MFDSFMMSHGYNRTTSDHCVFIRKFSDDDFIILLLYVDDMLIIGHNSSKIYKLKRELSKSFSMKLRLGIGERDTCHEDLPR